MAYGNWGAFVYKDDVRQKNREDNTPYKEGEIQAGYYQAFQMKDDEIRVVHATLGNGFFRLCGYKYYPIIYWKGEEVDLLPYQLGKNAGTLEWDWSDSDGISGEIEGYKFKAIPQMDPDSVILELTEPDGTKWKSQCGYEMGSGFED